MGFETPQDEWFREEQFSQFAMKILKSSRFKDREIIDPKIAIKYYKNHLTGELIWPRISGIG